jgi:GSH-dependent disulfide-bond oxidoreductase
LDKAEAQPMFWRKRIELFFWPTPNGYKISIALEEMRLRYVMRPVNIGKGEQFAPDFLEISPNNRMPALIDPKGPGGKPISIFESGAILQYLGRKTGRFYPKQERERTLVDQWLMWQMAGLGPMAGQFSHFTNYAPKLVDDDSKIAYARTRYANELDRLLGVLDRRLADSEFIAGAYSIADMASFPWVRSAQRMGISIEPFPRLQQWFALVNARPAVTRGLALGEELRRQPADMSKQEAAEAAKHLFGQTARSTAQAATAKQS